VRQVGLLPYTSVTVGRRLVDLVLWSVVAAAAYDFELIVVELIVVGWVAWSRKSENAFFSCESSSFKASTVFLSSAICAWLCSWPQVGERKGSVLAVSSLCCSELTLASKRTVVTHQHVTKSLSPSTRSISLSLSTQLDAYSPSPLNLPVSKCYAQLP